MTNETTEATQADTDETPAAPVITVTRGNPNAEEVAAVTVLLAAMSSDAGESEPNLRRGWARPSRRFNRATVPGAGWGRR